MRQSDFWNFGTEKESLVHRIHKYPAKFPGFITTKALQYAEKQGVKVETVADIFCGCGTTAVEAKRNGKKFWGCDINPVATMIAEVKTKQYKDCVLETYFSAIVNRFSSIKIDKDDIDTMNDRIKYWYDEENIKNLFKLKEAIFSAVSQYSLYRKFFLCAFSNILKPTSRWLAKSIKPQFDPDKTPKDVMEAFKNQFEFMRKANNENIFSKSNGSSIQIMSRNFLAMRADKNKADLIVTSPPYATSYDYADIHQLSALWLGFCSDNYRDMRKNMVGNTYKVKTPSIEEIESLPASGKEMYRRLARKDKKRASSVAKYFADISKSVSKCHDFLNKNGMAVFVIGNTNYRGVDIDNKIFLHQCMKRKGFQKVKIFPRKISLKILTPYRDSKGRFTRNIGNKEVYKNEFVLIGRKI